MQSPSPSSFKVNYIEDYSPPVWLTPKAHIRFDLDTENTIVRTEYEVCLNSDQNGKSLPPLFLNGEGLEFLSLRVDGAICDPGAYQISKEGLTLSDPPRNQFQLVVENKISPKRNTGLEGLYQSNSMLCTQNEPEGFRKITYSVDRPDNMIRFSVSLVGDKEYFPILLSNGNHIETKEIHGGKQEVIWEDPFPKPTYLFAIVAGDLAEIRSTYTTLSGREIVLKIFVDKGNQDKTEFAMYSLKEAMRWDEETFGLEYDLDLYMIVAVDDFNMGAMENKGLNLFNSKLVLADKKSATDETFESILGVVAHEYFHNYTGNRVTLRNWFNLTLKEGLTVFRDQWFTEDKTDPAVKRIKDVTLLMDHQFPEDAGPMSHPIVPKSYVEMNNFYTVTVYEKGAEVIRMLSVILGREGFKKGLKNYLNRYDGQGVTYEEFIHSMEEANQLELPMFRNWYDRKGTPNIEVSEDWNENTGTYSLEFTDTDKTNLPLLFPIPIALFDADGTVLKEELFIAKGFKSEINWDGFLQKPIASVFRNFSAPVKVKFDRSREDIVFLAKQEKDGFSRFFALQEVIKQCFESSLEGKEITKMPEVLQVIENTLSDRKNLAKDYLSYLLSFPSIGNLAESLQVFDYEIIEKNRNLWLATIADRFVTNFQEIYEENRISLPTQTRTEIGKRRLQNTSLYYLFHSKNSLNRLGGLALQKQRDAKHMSEELSIVRLLSEMNHELKAESFAMFYEKWKSEPLVLDYWFAAQVGFGTEALETVRRLKDHEKFNWSNPNRVRSLIGSFARNPLSFHKADGSGYRFLGESIEKLNSINPQIAANLTKLFQNAWLQTGQRPTIAAEVLENLLKIPQLSREVTEIVTTIRKGWGL